MSRSWLGTERYRSGWSADDAIGDRQVPVTVGVVVAAVVLLTSGEPESGRLIVAATTLVATVQIITTFGDWSRWPGAWTYVPPLLQMLAIALLDAGAGLEHMAFDVLLMLPVLGLAARPGRTGLVLALTGATVVLLVPVVLDLGRVQPVLHAIVTLVIVGPVAVGVHTIVGVSRRQAQELTAAGEALSVAARELRDSRDTLASILAAATEQGFVATDMEGVILSVNTGAERMFGRVAADLVGRNVVELLAARPAPSIERRTGVREMRAPDTPELRALVGEAADAGSVVTEWDGVLPDGSRRDLELVVTPRPALAGAAPELPPGYLFVATDVTTRHEEESAQDQFIGLVSHELRTPLASILGYVDLLLLSDDALDEEQVRYLRVVERSAHRLQGLIDDLLTSAQIVAGGYALAPEEIDAAQVVRDIVESERPAARAAAVRIHVGGDTTVPVLSDPQRLAQVVTNIVSNAVKYSYRGGVVEVTVTSEPTPDGAHAARIRVRDHGRGIAADELEHVTERFYRTRETRRLRVRGVGLGLALVRTLVDQHGGTMTITSEPGVGTQVDVVLPDLGTAAPDSADGLP